MLLAERNRLHDYIESLPATTILGIQDTTEADFTGNRVSKKLGCLNYINRKGRLVHNQLLTDANGICLGMFNQNSWSQDPELFGVDKSNWALEKKESVCWLKNFELFQSFISQFPQHTGINICDRAADYYELYEARKTENVHLIIRNRINRKLTSGEKLWTTLEQLDASGTYTAKIRDAKKKEHDVIFSVKYTSVEVGPNKRAKRDQPKNCDPVKLNAILVEQVSPLFKGQEDPIIWRLLTTLEVNSFEDAFKVVELYMRRWRIEEFHYVLKQGAKIEELQLKEPEAIDNAITMYSLLACQVMNLRYAITELPEKPIEDFGFTQQQYKVMATYLFKKKRIKSAPKEHCENIEQFTKLVKALATTSNPNKPPGVKSIWTGLKELKLIMEIFETFK